MNKRLEYLSLIKKLISCESREQLSDTIKEINEFNKEYSITPRSKEFKKFEIAIGVMRVKLKRKHDIIENQLRSQKQNNKNNIKIIITESQYKVLTELSTWFETDKSSCSPDKIDADNWQELYGELVKSKLIKPGTKLLIVWGDNQTLYYTQDGKSLTKSFRVSTGANGFNNQPDNKETPTGLLQIKGKVKAKEYEVLVSKTPIGKILGPNVNSTRVDNAGNKHIAEVLTGLLELDGLESCNKNTFSRNIYFHGTNKEKFLGTPRSNGCIRVSNSNVQWMLNNIPEGTKVYIKP